MPGHDALLAVQMDFGMVATFREVRPQARQIPPEFALFHACTLSSRHHHKQKCL
jgi:hypothetical protein